MRADDSKPREASSYREILTSSALIGGSTLINVLVGIVRTKAMAVLLGPTGYGLLGAYALIGDLARTVAQLGINSSGVRQIAAAASSGDAKRVSRTALLLRRAALACGGIGALSLVWLAAPISQFSFGTTQYASGVALLAVSVFVGVLSAAQGAVLQGLRRIADIARVAIYGALTGTAVSVALVYALGRDGIVPSLIAVAASSLLFSWWYSRRLPSEAVSLSATQTLKESGALLKLGIAFMGSALLTMGAAYAVRVFILRTHGLEAAGLYNAAWTLGGLYVGFVLQALGTDFYPRLVGAATDDALCNRLVNEQAHISLLLALPGVLGTLTFAPLVVSLFYSGAFAGAVEILRWICLGMALRVLTWPLGYIVVAKNRQTLFFSIDLAWTVVNVGLSWWCINRFGIVGAGIAFFASYVFHAAMVYPIARRVSGFRWSPATARLAARALLATSALFVALCWLSPTVGAAFGLLLTVASAYASARRLLQLMPGRRLPRPLQWLLTLTPGRA
jgi:antigen flippase